MQEIAIGSDAVHRTHGSILELHYVEIEHMLERGAAHLCRHNLPEAGKVCIPLARELFGHNVRLIIAAYVVVEIRPVPEVLTECPLRALEKTATTPSGRALSRLTRDIPPE